ncbi:MAG: kinase, partial [Fibrobacter sp.]|nr:kinase [Fibrobacter sp.]
MEYYNKELCVTFDELTSGDDPVMKVGTLKSLRHRDRLRVACRAGGEGTCALFVYSSLPAKYKARYVAKYGE